MRLRHFGDHEPLPHGWRVYTITNRGAFCRFRVRCWIVDVLQSKHAAGRPGIGGVFAFMSRMQSLL